MNLYVILGITLLMIIGFLTSKWSYGLVAMTCVVLLVITNQAKIETAFAGFAMKNFILVAGMYVISGAFGKTSLITKVQNRVMRLQGGKSGLVLVAILVALTAVLAQFLPASANISVMILILNALSQDGEVTPSRMLLPLAVMSSLWVGHLPIGIGATTYIAPNKYIAAYKSTQLLQIWDIAKVNIIPMILGGIYIMFTYKWLPKRPILSNKLAKVKENAAMPKKHEILIYVVFVLVMASMFMSSILGDLMYITPIVGTLILVFSKAMSEKETKEILSSDILFMLAGIFVMADMIAGSGAGKLIGTGILKVLGGNPSGYAVLFAFGIVSIILTQFMSNSGCKNVLLPMAVATCIAAKYDPRGVICVVELCCSASAILPTASPACAIAFGAGEYKLSETLKFTIPLTLITLVSVVLCANFFFPVNG